MTLPKETINKIKAEAEKNYPFKWPLNSKEEEMVQRVGQNPHGWAKHQKIVKAYEAGAIEWMGKAQPLADAVQGFIDEVDTEGLTEDRLKELITTLAKYKEVNNG